MKIVCITLLIPALWFVYLENPPDDMRPTTIFLTLATLLLAIYDVKLFPSMLRRNPAFLLHDDSIDCTEIIQRRKLYLKEILEIETDNKDNLQFTVRNRKDLICYPAADLSPPLHILEYSLINLKHISEKGSRSFREQIEKDVEYMDAREEYLAQKRTQKTRNKR